MLKSEGMSDLEAEEYFGFNIVGAWMGEGTPRVSHDSRRNRTIIEHSVLY